MTTTVHMRNLALGGIVGVAVAAGTVLAASGSRAAPESTEQASSSAQADASSVDPIRIPLTAAPGPCTAQDRAAKRWSIRLTFTNPRSAGALDYIANVSDQHLDLDSDTEASYFGDLPLTEENNGTSRHLGTVQLRAGQTGSMVIKSGIDFFPSVIEVLGGADADLTTFTTQGKIFNYNIDNLRSIATLCGSATPAPSTTSATTSATPSASASPSAPTTSAAPQVSTSPRTEGQTLNAEPNPTRSGSSTSAPHAEPPTPTPSTTRLAVTG